MNIFSSILSKLCSQKGRVEKAKTIFELISKKYPDNKLVSVALQKTNRILNLSDGHNSFHQNARENKKLNEEEISNHKLHLNSTPQLLAIGTTHVCNVKPPCVQCPKHAEPRLGYINNNAYHISKDYIKRLQPFARRSVLISLHGVGEPLTCPYLFESLKYVEHNDTAKCLSTNGLLITESTVEKLLSNRINNISFSLDAATAETYKKIRHHNFEKVINNIKDLVNARDARELKVPVISINMTLMRENVKEVPEFIRLAKQLDANVHLFHLIKGPSYKFDWFDYDFQHCDNDPQAHDLYVEEGYRIADELGVEIIFIGKRNLLKEDSEVFAIRIPSTDELNSPHPETEVFYRPIKVDKKRFWCDFPWNQLFVATNGNVHNCCWQENPLGNLKTSSIWEIWNGKDIKEIRKSTAEGIPHPLCNHKDSVCPYVLAFASSNKQVITSGDYKK
jgi:MoaA/NifB/PqqE/SkfB family radical SAM enzyme